MEQISCSLKLTDEPLVTKYLLFCKSNKSVAKTPIGNFSALFKAPSSSEILGVLAKHLIFSHSIIEHYRSPRPEQKFIKKTYIQQILDHRLPSLPKKWVFYFK